MDWGRTRSIKCPRSRAEASVDDPESEHAAEELVWLNTLPAVEAIKSCES